MKLQTVTLAMVMTAVVQADTRISSQHLNSWITIPHETLSYDDYCWGEINNRGRLRLYNRASSSSEFAIGSISAAYFERLLRFGLYDLTPTTTPIYDDGVCFFFTGPGWAQQYYQKSDGQYLVDLRPFNNRYYNYSPHPNLRILGSSILHNICDCLFHRTYTDDISRFTWSTTAPADNAVIFPEQSYWTDEPPYMWMYGIVSRWAYALPTLAHISSRPFDDYLLALGKVPSKILLYNFRTGDYSRRTPEGLWLKVNRDDFLGTDYNNRSSNVANSLTDPFKRSFNTSTNAVWSDLFTGFGFTQTNADLICNALSRWASISNSAYGSRRLSADALGGLNWSIAALDETYVEQYGYDSSLNAISKAESSHSADFETDEVTMTFAPNSVGVPVFTTDQPMHARRTGGYSYSVTTEDPTFTNSGYVVAWEKPRDVEFSATQLQSTTNYAGWYVIKLLNGISHRFEDIITQTLNENRQDIWSNHLNTSKMTIKVTGVAWSLSPSWHAASVYNEITLSNRYAKATYNATESLFQTMFDIEERSQSFGPFKAVGLLNIKRTVEAGGTLPSTGTVGHYDTNDDIIRQINFADGVGWPTANMWQNAEPEKVTLYELAAGYYSTNRAHIGFCLPSPSSTNGMKAYWRTYTGTASSRHAAATLRTNRIDAAVSALETMATRAGNALGISTDARAAWNADALYDMLIVKDTSVWDGILQKAPVIPQGGNLGSDCGLLEVSGTDLANERVFEADVDEQYDEETGYRFTFSNRSWETNSYGFTHWAWLKPHYDSVSSFCRTNYGGYACGVVNAHMLKITFDNSKWNAMSVSE